MDNTNIEEIEEIEEDVQIEEEISEKFTLIENTDHWREEDIRRTIEVIHNNGLTPNHREFLNKPLFPKFIERYPFLFKISCEDDIDYKTLNYMMNMRRKVIDDGVDIEKASKAVGNKFFNEYVAPAVKEIKPTRKVNPENAA
jgi:hypothetical protein